MKAKIIFGAVLAIFMFSSCSTSRHLQKSESVKETASKTDSSATIYRIDTTVTENGRTTEISVEFGDSSFMILPGSVDTTTARALAPSITAGGLKITGPIKRARIRTTDNNKVRSGVTSSSTASVSKQATRREKSKAVVKESVPVDPYKWRWILILVSLLIGVALVVYAIKKGYFKKFWPWVKKLLLL